MGVHSPDIRVHYVITTGSLQVRVFAENPTTFIDSYSKEFDDAFMEVLRRKGENVSFHFCIRIHQSHSKEPNISFCLNKRMDQLASKSPPGPLTVPLQPQVRSKATALWHEVIADRHHIHMNATRFESAAHYHSHEPPPFPTRSPPQTALSDQPPPPSSPGGSL